MCVTDMLDDCFAGMRGEEMIGEIHSKVVKKSKSMRVMTARRRNTMSSINTFFTVKVRYGGRFRMGDGGTLLMTKGTRRGVLFMHTLYRFSMPHNT
jgi:hypothetical protein